MNGRATRAWAFGRFAFVHALRDMWRNRSRTAFALICVATGVAAIVALRTLALMIGDEMTTNLAQSNRGDIHVYASDGTPELMQTDGGMPVFTEETVGVMRNWARQESVEISLGRKQFEQLSAEPNGTPHSAAVMLLGVEPQRYPFYDTITTTQPDGLTLAEVFDRPVPEGAYPIVISNALARSTRLGVGVGDEVQIGSSDARFVVVGVSQENAETVVTAPETFFWDYAYLRIEDLTALGLAPLPTDVYFKVPRGRDIAEAEKSLIAFLQAHYGADATDFDAELNRATVPELAEQNGETANTIDDLILVMGLSSLLIGGIGIINTMLVVVNRRTLEIAVLKTLGLKGSRVTFLFLVEALLMGVIGSLLGLVLGVLLSYSIRNVGEEALRVSLTWRIYPEALGSGMILGVVVTALFGFLPTLIAGQVRPAIVLRPNEAQMPAAGLLQTLFALLAMIVVLGVLVNSIVGEAFSYSPVYMIAGGGALVGLFAGVILANTRLGQPLPDYYQFRLARRYERLENALLRWVGALFGGLPLRSWEGLPRPERGRCAITAGLRGLRQIVLLYGALAIGALVASGIMALAAELWRPMGLGETKPVPDVLSAVQSGVWGWVALWTLLVLIVGGVVRWFGRPLAGLIALGSLGVTLGGALSFALGGALEATLGGTSFWDALARFSTGIVLVEGAFAALGAVFVAFWVLVWALGKVPTVLLLGLVSVVVVGLGVSVAAAVAMLGQAALFALIALAALAWLSVRLGLWGRFAPSAEVTTLGAPTRRAPAVEQVARQASPAMLGTAALGGGFLLLSNGRQIGLLIVLALVVALWWRLRQHYRVDGHLVKREIGGRRARVASTLLGLTVGLAGLSLVALTTDAVNYLLQSQMNETIEGNLIAISPLPDHMDEMDAALRDLDDVESYAVFSTYDAVLLQVNGEPVVSNIPEHRRQRAENSNWDYPDEGIATAITERMNVENVPDYRMVAGRNLGPQDVGKPRVILRESFFSQQYGIDVGDKLLFLLRDGQGKDDEIRMEFEVIGLISRNSQQNGLEAAGDMFSVAPGVLSDAGVKPQMTVAIAQVDETDPEAIDRVKAQLGRIPGVVAFELGAITQMLEDMINQLKAIPTLVAWLALVAGTAIIANTVALAAQERRRQIGVMKALGLKGWRVLAMLLVENGLVGFLAGGIGAVVGFVATVMIVLTTQSPQEIRHAVNFGVMGWLIVLAIGVSLGAAALSAWSAAAEKPMNVLRYE